MHYLRDNTLSSRYLCVLQALLIELCHLNYAFLFNRQIINQLTLVIFKIVLSNKLIIDNLLYHCSTKVFTCAHVHCIRVHCAEQMIFVRKLLIHLYLLQPLVHTSVLFLIFIKIIYKYPRLLRVCDIRSVALLLWPVMSHRIPNAPPFELK